MIRSSTPVLRVSDYARAKDFYTKNLGFTCTLEAGEPVGFAILKRDDAQLFIEAYAGAEAPYDRWRGYFHVAALDDLAAEFKANGVTLSQEPWSTGYGMREFEVTDPDGNVLGFGEEE